MVLLLEGKLVTMLYTLLRGPFQKLSFLRSSGLCGNGLKRDSAFTMNTLKSLNLMLTNEPFVFVQEGIFSNFLMNPRALRSWVLWRVIRSKHCFEPNHQSSLKVCRNQIEIRSRDRPVTSGRTVPKLSKSASSKHQTLLNYWIEFAIMEEHKAMRFEVRLQRFRGNISW